MTGFSPLRLFGVLAIAAGVMRIASSFISFDATSAPRELLSLAIDLCLLFGLTGYYFAHAARLGIFGFLGYLVAASGIAFITGPDGVAFGVDIYETGVAIIGAGLILLSIMLLVRGQGPIAAPAAFLLAAAASVVGGAIGRPVEGFQIAGVLFGLAYVTAGLSMIRATASS